jgi:ABC-type branched-subunit amino acid transport system ATPase component
MYEAFKRLYEGGRTIILVEENPLRALEITKRALRVERGILDERIDGQLAEHLAEAASLEGKAP